MKELRFVFAVMVAFIGIPFAEALEFSPEVPQEVQELLLQDMQALQTLRGNYSSSLFKEYFSAENFSGLYIRQYIESQAGVIQYGPPPIEGAAAFMGRRGLTLTPRFVELATRGGMSWIERIGILVHEVRHGARAASRHVQCPDPFVDSRGEDIRSYGILVAGLRACDDTPFGSYGFEFVYHANVAAHCQTCTAQEIESSRRIARRLLDRIIDERAREALLRDLLGD